MHVKSPTITLPTQGGAFRLGELDTLKRLAAVLPDAVYIVDRDYRLIYTNRHFRRMLEYNGRDPIPCHEASKLGLCKTNCVLQGCMSTQMPTMWQESVAGQGTDKAYKVRVGASPLVDEQGNVIGAFVVLRDIDAEVTAYDKWREMLESERRAKENLETIVASRTRALLASNRALELSRREVRDILDNIQQAVFTVSKHLRINGEYSKHVTAVFGEVTVAGQPVSAFLAPGAAQNAGLQSELENWLRLVFSQPLLDWETVSQLVPRELEYIRPTDGSKRALLLEFRPIRENPPEISRVMVVAEDITDKKALERDLARKQQENEENLAQVAELIQIDPGTFHVFLAEATVVLTEARRALDHLAGSTGATYMIDELFRQMHTLKGNARSFKLARIASRAHWVEETFAKLRGASTIEQSLLDETLERIDELDAQLAKARTLANRVITTNRDLAKTRDGGREPEVRVTVAQLRQMEAKLAELCAQIESPELGQLLDEVRDLALVPMSRLFQRFPKMAHDLATELGKHIDELLIEGADQTRIDVQVLHRLGNVMVHLIRNAIDHGIELPDQRRAANKRTGGRLAVRAKLSDVELVIVVEDDGRGIDREAVLKKAVATGLIDEAVAPYMTEADIIRLIFRPGFSTAVQVTDVSGRGVGMDAVIHTIKQLSGKIKVHTREGVGTRIRIVIPANVALGKQSPVT